VDEELDVMNSLALALARLDQATRDRVLDWANKKFGSRAIAEGPGEEQRFDPGTAVGSRFREFGELFHAAEPTSDRQKALLAAYWLQFVEGADNFASQALNSLLKNLGYGVSNITAALSQLQEERPALAIQLRKSGASQQARKIYKLTDSGRRKVEDMLHGERDA
jgi:hypothetical protein